MRWTSDVFAAAIDAGAMMDSTYHPGVWRSVKYTCCDAINKHAAGCKHTTHASAAAETAVNEHNSSERVSRCSVPVPLCKKRKKTFVYLLRIAVLSQQQQQFLWCCNMDTTDSRVPYTWFI